MKAWFGIPFTLALLVLAIYLEAYVPVVPVTLTTILGTSAWAAWDSWQIGLSRYESAMAHRPVEVFFSVAIVWIATFPAYLHARARVLNGEAALKPVPLRG